MPKNLPEEQFQTLLRDYLSNDLTEQDRSAFELLLEESEEARSELAFSKRLRFAEEKSDLLAVSGIASKVILATSLATPPRKISDKMRWIWGSLLAGLLLLGGWWLYQTNSPQAIATRQGTSIAMTQLEPLEPLLVTIATRETELEKGMNLYRNKDYAAAAKVLGTYARSNADLNASLYAGVSALLAGETEKALELLKTANNAPPPIGFSARYYLTLARLMKGELDIAGKMAETTAATDPFYHQYQEIIKALQTQD